MRLTPELPGWFKRPSWREFSRPWFAWHPVKTIHGEWVWLETVMRKYAWYRVCWEYSDFYEQTEKPPTRWQCYMIDIYGRRTFREKKT